MHEPGERPHESFLHQVFSQRGVARQQVREAGAMLDALTLVRNKASLAHPNKDLLGRADAQLVVNAGRTLLAYLDAKTGAE